MLPVLNLNIWKKRAMFCLFSLLITCVLVVPVIAENRGSDMPDVTFVEYGIFLNCLINDLEYKFLLDTGATYSIFDNSFEPLLGMPAKTATVESPTGVKEVKMFKPVEMIYGGEDISTRHPIVMADLGIFKKVSGVDFQGIIGMATMYDKIWDLNFDEKTLTIRDRMDFTPLEEGFTIYNIPPLGQGVPGLRVSVAGKEFNFIIDTGDIGFGRLQNETVELLRRDGLIQNEAVDTSVNMSGVVETRVLKVDGIALGKEKYSGVLMRESNQNALGMGFLSKYHAIFDFQMKKMYLKPGLGMFRVDKEDKSGVKLITHEGKIYVAHVVKDSPADKCGVNEKDIVSSVDGRKVSGQDLHFVRDVFKGEDNEEIVIRVSRNGKEIELSVILKAGYNYI